MHENDTYGIPPTSGPETRADIPAWATRRTSPGVKSCSDLCRRTSARPARPPLITYTDEEQRIWREVSPQLDALHRQYQQPSTAGKRRAGHQRARDSATRHLTRTSSG